MPGNLFKPLATALGLFLMTNSVRAEYALNFPEPITETAREVYDLHMLIFWICVAIGVLVFGAMIYSIINHRKSKNPNPPQFHHSTAAEIVWTIIPFVILIAMAVPATRVLINMETIGDSDLTIKITGSQFKWDYDYMDEGFTFSSSLTTPQDQIDNKEEKGENYLLEVDNNIVIPSDTKVRFLLTAKDVLHAWWIPAISVKKDAVPGFINEMWTKVDLGREGIYRGQCAELCGARHGFMPIVLEVKTPEDYKAWVDEMKVKFGEDAKKNFKNDWTLAEMMAEGEQVYAGQCTVCHQATGAGLPPAFPALKGSPMTTTGTIEDHVALLLNGRQGTAMASFGQLDNWKIAALVTYTRNAWDNNTGALVQPQDIEALRAQ